CPCYLASRSLPSFPTRRSSDLPETLANSGWGAPEYENAAEIAAVEGAPEEVGTAALTFEEGPENGTSLYKDAERMPLDELLEDRSEEHTSELQSRFDLVCRLLL